MNKSSILTRLYEDEEIIIPATSGQRTFAEATDVFSGYYQMDQLEEMSSKIINKPTISTPSSIYTINKDPFSFEEDLEPLIVQGGFYFTQEQVIIACENFREKLGLVNLFPVNTLDFPLLVIVHIEEGELEIYFRQFREATKDSVMWSGFRECLFLPR